MALHPKTLELATQLIEHYEGIRTEAYLDPVGVPTICAGITVYPHGQAVRMGDVCTKEVCAGHLQELLKATFVPKLETIPGWQNFGANRQAALIDFAWNMGPGFYGSSGFDTITRVLRDGAANPEAYQGMRAALMLYVKAGGRTLPGLVTRRTAEADLWEKETELNASFVCRHDTYLKKAPIDSKYLSDEGRHACYEKEMIAVSSWEEIPENNHAKVTLAKTGEDWFIWQPHWERGARNSKQKSLQIDWQDFDCPIADYITVGEILHYDRRRVPERGSAIEAQLITLARTFSEIRIAWGGPIAITGAYCPEPINRQCCGSKGSLHSEGQALDLCPVDGSLKQFVVWMKKRWSGGLGDCSSRGFCHIDTRGGGGFSRRPVARPKEFWTL